MCIMCVEIARERIKVRDAMDQLREANYHGAIDADPHKKEIMDDWLKGDMKKFGSLVKSGYKKERWL